MSGEDPSAYSQGPLLKSLVNKLSQHVFCVHWENCFIDHSLFSIYLKRTSKSYNQNIVVDLEES